MTLTPRLKIWKVVLKAVPLSKVARDLNSWTKATLLTNPGAISTKVNLSILASLKPTTRSRRNMSALRMSSECSLKRLPILSTTKHSRNVKVKV